MQHKEESTQIDTDDQQLLLARLEEVSRRLFMLNRNCAVSTFGNVLLGLLSIVAIGWMYRLSALMPLYISVFNLYVAVVSIFLLYRFDHLRKLGDAIFQELSDELEWSPYQRNAKTNWSSTKPPGTLEVPRAKIRLAFREFLLSSTLPLAGREGGVRNYLLINVVSTFSVLILMALKF